MWEVTFSRVEIKLFSWVQVSKYLKTCVGPYILVLICDKYPTNMNFQTFIKELPNPMAQNILNNNVLFSTYSACTDKTEPLSESVSEDLAYI